MRKLIALVGVAILGCAKTEPSVDATPQPVEPPSSAKVVEEKTPPTPASPTPEPVAPAPVEVASAETKISLAQQAIETSRSATPTWSELRRLDGAFDLQPIDLGIVLSGASTYVVDPAGEFVTDSVVMRTDKYGEAPSIEGSYPTDLFVLRIREVERSEVSVAVHKWRNNRWVAQSFFSPSSPSHDPANDRGEKVRKLELDINEIYTSKSPRGGMLLAMPGEQQLDIVRVAGSHPDPTQPQVPDLGEEPADGGSIFVVDFFETRGGAVAIAVSPDGTNRRAVRLGCGVRQQDCPGTRVLELPAEHDLEHGNATWAPVGDHGFAVELNGAGGNAMIVFDGQRASIQTLPSGRSLRRMLADPKGGLWLVAGVEGRPDELLHRSPDGSWEAVTLPEAAAGGRVSIGLRDPEHLVLVAKASDATTVFETTLGDATKAG